MLVSTLSALLSVAVCSPISPFSFSQQSGGAFDDDFVDFDDDAAAGGQGTQHIDTGLVVPLQIKWWVCAAREIRMDSYTWLPYAALDGVVVAILTLLPISIGRWLLRRSHLSAESAHHSPFAKLARLQRIGGFFFFLSYAWSSVHRAQDSAKPPKALACCEGSGGGSGDALCCCCRRTGLVAWLCKMIGRLFWDPQARPPTDPPGRKASITGPPDARLSRATEMVCSEGGNDGAKEAAMDAAWVTGSEAPTVMGWHPQSLNQPDHTREAPLLGDKTDPDSRTSRRAAAAGASSMPLQQDAKTKRDSKWKLGSLLGKAIGGSKQAGAAQPSTGRRQSLVSTAGRQRRSRARKLAAASSMSNGGVPLAAEEFSLSLYHALPTGSAWIDRRSLDNGDDISVTTVAGARDACFCILHITPKYVLSPNCVTELLSACERPDPSTIFALVDTSPPLDWSAVNVGGTPWESSITSPSGSSGGWGLAIDLAEALHRAGCRVVTSRAGLISELSSECLRLPHLVPNWRAEAHWNAERGLPVPPSSASLLGGGQTRPEQSSDHSLRQGANSGSGSSGAGGAAAAVAVASGSGPRSTPSSAGTMAGSALKSSGLRGLESALVHYWRRAPEDKAPLPRDEMALTIACRASALPPVIIAASLFALGVFVVSPLLPLHFEKAGMASAVQAARRMPWVVIVLTVLIVVQAARLLSQAFVNFAVGHSQSMIPLLLAAEVDPNLCLFVVRGHDSGAVSDSGDDSESDCGTKPHAANTSPQSGAGGQAKPPPLGSEFRSFVQSEVGFRSREVTYEQAQRLWMLCIDTMTAPAFSSEQRRIAKFAAQRTGGQGLSTWQSPLDLSHPQDLAAQAANRTRGLGMAASGSADARPTSASVGAAQMGVARPGAARAVTGFESAAHAAMANVRTVSSDAGHDRSTTGLSSMGRTTSSEHEAPGPGLGPSLTAEPAPSAEPGTRAPPLARATSATATSLGGQLHRRASSHKTLRATVRAVQFLIGRTKHSARDPPPSATVPPGRPSSVDHSDLSDLWVEEGGNDCGEDADAEMDNATHDSILSLIAQLCGLSTSDLELFEWSTRLRLVAYLRQMQPEEVEQEARDLAVELGLQPDGRAEHEEWKALLFPNCFVFCVETVPDAEAYFHHFMGMVRVCQTLLVNYQTVLAPYAPIASSLSQEQAAAAASKGGAAADSETDVDPLTALRSVLFQDMSSPSIAKDLFARLAAKIGALVHRPRLGAEGLRPWFLNPTVSPVLERVGRQVRLRDSVAEQIRSWLVAPLSGVFQWHSDVDAENDPSRAWLEGGLAEL